MQTAVHAAVCGGVWHSSQGSARHHGHGSVRAVRAAVCSSALGSVYMAVQQCVREWQCGSGVWRCARLCVGVRTAVFGSVWRCLAVFGMCGSAHGSVRAAVHTAQCVAVRLLVVYIWQCVQPYAAVCRSAAVYTVRQCRSVGVCSSAAVCGNIFL